MEFVEVTTASPGVEKGRFLVDHNQFGLEIQDVGLRAGLSQKCGTTLANRLLPRAAPEEVCALGREPDLGICLGSAERLDVVAPAGFVPEPRDGDKEGHDGWARL